MLADYILFVSVQSKSGRGPRKHFDERLQLDKETFGAAKPLQARPSITMQSSVQLGANDALV